MTTNLNFKSRRRGTTAAGLGGLALASVLLLCGAGNAPIENFTPQGAMQADLNAGGHSLTNAATVSATNVAAANLTVNGKALAVNNALTLAGTDGSTLNVGAGGTLGSNAFTSTVDVPATTTVNGHALTNSVTVSASDLATGTLPDAQLPADVVTTGSTQTVTGTKTFSSAPILGSDTFKTSAGIYTIAVPAVENDTMALLGASQTFTGVNTFTQGASFVSNEVVINSGGSINAQDLSVNDIYYFNGSGGFPLIDSFGNLYYGNDDLLGDPSGRFYADAGLISSNGSGGLVVTGLSCSGGIQALDFEAPGYYVNNTTLLEALSAGVLGVYNTSTGTPVLANVLAANFNSAAPQTTVNGSASGAAIFSQPLAGSSFKLVSVHLAALNGTASYTFPAAFTNAPTEVSGSGLATSLSTTAVTVTGSTTTKDLILIGY